jgi:rod shape-determining protein MreC
MRQYLNFKRNDINYNLQHNLSSTFKKIEMFFLIILSIVMIITSRVNRSFSDNVTIFFVSCSEPIISTISLPFNVVVNLFTDFNQLISAKNENIALREENNKLRDNYIKALNIYEENKELKSLLNFISPKVNNFKSARVIGRTNQIFTNQIFIDAGIDSNIKEGSVVSGTIGMIGRVVNIGLNKSAVMLLTDAKSRVPIITSKSRVAGVLSGNNTVKMDLLYLQKNHNIAVGERVFTSGDGETMPAGILIGVVIESEKENVVVQMVENVANLDFVSVVAN